MKLLRNRLFLATIAILVAVVICVVILPKVSQNQNKVTTIAVVTQDVTVGTKLTSAMVTEKTVGSYGMPNGVVTKTADLIGKIAVSNLSSRNYVFTDSIVDETQYEDEYGIESKLAADSQLVSVSVKSLSASVAGQIKPGDVVDIVYTHTETITNPDTYTSVNSTTVVRPEELKGLVVYSVSNSELQTSSAVASDTAFIPVVVTFVADKAQAEKLVGLEYSEADHMHILLNK